MGDFGDNTQRHPPLRAELQTALDLIPAFAWYCTASGGLTFLNERGSDYLGLPKDHPIRHGIDTGAEWDSHIPLLHPDDHEEARRVWSTCLRTGSAVLPLNRSACYRRSVGGNMRVSACCDLVQGSRSITTRLKRGFP